MNKEISLYNYRGAIPFIIAYQFVSKGFIYLCMQVYGLAVGGLLWSVGRTAFTSGDLPFLMRTWQGWVLLLVGFLVLVFYTAIDINATLVLSYKILQKQKINVLKVIIEGIANLRRFTSPYGVMVVLFVSLIAPITISSLGISLTKDFVIPDFIMSVIYANSLYRIGYLALLALMNLLAFFCIFTFHYTIAGNSRVKSALVQSVRTMCGNWRVFIKEFLLYFIKTGIVALGIILLFNMIPFGVRMAHSDDLVICRTCLLFGAFGTLFLGSVMGMVILQFNMMKLTILYEKFNENSQVQFVPPDKKLHLFTPVFLILVFVGIGGISWIGGTYFDILFPADVNTRVVAHRAGGVLGNENTILAMDRAIDSGAFASEIDVQRTKDNHYIINHDSTFMRICGDPHEPRELTLDEIKKLGVIDENDPDAPRCPVATIEEFLDNSKGRINLFIELKGSTADIDMANDIYKMIKERDMIDSCSFISLDYGLIDKIETQHPDMKTGYLCYYAFGDVADMNCDMLLLEAETATDYNINMIHDAGKEIYIWTLNSWGGIAKALVGDADGIITDQVEMADLVKMSIIESSDEARVLDAILQ